MAECQKQNDAFAVLRGREDFLTPRALMRPAAVHAMSTRRNVAAQAVHRFIVGGTAAKIRYLRLDPLGEAARVRLDETFCLGGPGISTFCCP
jgi:hypothetical protein